MSGFQQGDRVWLYDTTLRDGAQGAGVSFTLKDKLRVAERLDAFGIDYIEGGWPGSNPKDLEFFRQARNLRFSRAKLAAFGSTRRPGTRVQSDPNVRALLDAGTPVVTVFGKSWDLHVTQALETTLDENLAMIEETVRYLKERVDEVVYDAEHFFDGFRHNPDYALRTLQAAEAGGADWIVLCDTNGGTLTPDLAAAVEAVRRVIRTPLGIHTHDDSGLAVANALEAVRLGARQVQGTVNGYGERCGNANLCTVIPNLQLKMGIPCVPEESLAGLTGLAYFVSELANAGLHPSLPYVGAHAFAHKGGVHVSAILKDVRTYEHIDPALVGNRRDVVVSELSGQSNIVYKAREGLLGDLDRPQARALVEKVKQLEFDGYHFDVAEASFELLARKSLQELLPPFELEGFRVIVERRGDRRAYAEATVKVRVGDRTYHTAAEGDGPVNALDNALRKALEGAFPAIKRMKLVDYRVRVLDGQAGTASKVRVVIETQDDEDRWSTIGVSENIIEASWQALVDSLEYGLLRRKERLHQAGERTG
ncbi:MAG: citramalate synthase [Clostridia bacterium]|nr:citramalate synthase [Clostridia bacterium]